MNYEFPPDGADPTSDDRTGTGWCLGPGTRRTETWWFQQLPADHELQSMSAGKDAEGWESGMCTSVTFGTLFLRRRQALGRDSTSGGRYLPNTMDGDDTAEITCTMDQKEMGADRRTGPALKIPGSDLKNPGARLKVNRLELDELLADGYWASAAFW